MSDEHWRVSEEGKAIGRRMSQMADDGVLILELEGESTDKRCATCAFRIGTVPNGCILTQADVLKAFSQGDKLFTCHVNKGETCYGFYAARVAKRRTGIPDFNLPYEYSKDEDEAAAQ